MYLKHMKEVRERPAPPQWGGDEETWPEYQAQAQAFMELDRKQRNRSAEASVGASGNATPALTRPRTDPGRPAVRTIWAGSPSGHVR